MNFFSTLRIATILLLNAFAWISLAVAATPKDVQQLLQTDSRVAKLDKKQKHYGAVSLTIFTWQIQDDTYRMVYNPNGLATVTRRAKGQVAFSEIFRQNIRQMPVANLKNHILPEQTTVLESSGSAATTTKDAPMQEGKKLLSEDFSTSDVLSWNRLLNDVYKGNPVSAAGNHSNSSSGNSGTPQEDIGQAASMAKMMNQCGGQSKSNVAQKRAMQNIAQALVAASMAEKSHAIARASEGYTENSRDFDKGEKDSLIDAIDAQTKIDLQALTKSIQQAKRDIQKVLRSDFRDVSSMQEGPLDQQSLTTLRDLRKQHSIVQLQTLFSESSRNLVMSKSYLPYFTQANPPYVMWSKDRRSFVVNPLLTSQAAYRHALVQALVLWQQRF
jgi:hypothetical protein